MKLKSVSTHEAIIKCIQHLNCQNLKSSIKIEKKTQVYIQGKKDIILSLKSKSRYKTTNSMKAGRIIIHAHQVDPIHTTPPAGLTTCTNLLSFCRILYLKKLPFRFFFVEKLVLDVGY